MPSSSLVEFEFEVEVGVEVGDEVRVEVELSLVIQSSAYLTRTAENTFLVRCVAR